MFRWIALLGALSVTALAQPPVSERIGNLRINRTRVAWTSPESLVRDLRSDDDRMRFPALRLLGVDTDETSFGQTEVELRFVAFFSSQRKQAIILITGLNQAFAAIAAPKGNTWERFAVIGCFCQYGGAQLDRFVRVDLSSIPGDLAMELVITARGGGTGFFEDNELHFRLRGEDLQQVFSFVSRRDAFVYGSRGESIRERSWFIDGQLVEAKATLESKAEADRDLADGHTFKSITCTPYKWDAASFRYVPSGPAKPCAARTP